MKETDKFISRNCSTGVDFLFAEFSLKKVATKCYNTRFNPNFDGVGGGGISNIMQKISRHCLRLSSKTVGNRETKI
jgi:hypothetical protein